MSDLLCKLRPDNNPAIIFYTTYKPIMPGDKIKLNVLERIATLSQSEEYLFTGNDLLDEGEEECSTQE